jgi:hypothetical protein
MLATMTRWTVDQRGGLRSLLSRLPGPTATQAERSLSLLDQIQTRLRLLRADLPCGCLTHNGTDGLGPVPCVPCAQRSSSPQPGSTTSTGPRNPGGSGSGTPAPAPKPSVPGGGSGPGNSGPPLLPLPIPVLPPLPADPSAGFPPLLPPLLPS